MSGPTPIPKCGPPIRSNIIANRGPIRSATTLAVRVSLPRRYWSLTVSPGCRRRARSTSFWLSFRAVPLNRRITSPRSMPALSAGPSGTTPRTRAPPLSVSSSRKIPSRPRSEGPLCWAASGANGKARQVNATPSSEMRIGFSGPGCWFPMDAGTRSSVAVLLLPLDIQVLGLERGDEGSPVRRGAGCMLDQLLRPVPLAMAVHPVAEPAQQGGKVSSRELCVEIAQVGTRGGKQLGRIKVTQRVGREVADQAFGPMPILETTFDWVGRHHPQITLVCRIPGFWNVRRCQIARNQRLLELESDEDVQVVGHFVGTHADTRWFDPVDPG